MTSKYRVLSELGVGGMSNVYLAVSQGLAGFNKLVVLKALKPDLVCIPESRESFLREARLSARMSHPNVVVVNEVEENNGTPVIIMEYLQGQSLSAIQRRMRDQLPLEFVLRILSDSLSGLHYAHELADFDGTPLRLVHRDFTPQNVFVTYEGAVKVLDFGIAQVNRNKVRAKTDIIQGKIRYMSPEQIIGAPLDRRTDVFAAGVMLAEVASGQRFWGNLTEGEVVKRIVSRAIPSPRSFAAGCPEELDRMCQKALAFDRADRYETIAELQSDLEAYIATRSKRVTPQELGRQLATWFEAERRQALQLIEARLSDETNVSWSWIPTAPAGLMSNTPPAAAREIPTQPTDALASAVTQGVKRRRLLLWGTQAVVAATIVGAATLLSRTHTDRADAISAESRSANDVRKSAVIRITALPASATLFIDDVPVAENPYVKLAMMDDSWHQVRAQAPGYRPQVQRYQFNRDVEVVISLEAAKAMIDSVATSSAAPATATATAPKSASVANPVRTKKSVAKTKSSCSPPFTIDSRGLKRFKPECM